MIVIGVGAMGAAACDALARRGLRVLGLDRYDIPNTMGSSHGDSRVIRMCYYEHPDYVPLLRRAYADWRELDAFCDASLLNLVGGLFMGPEEDPLIAGSMSAADAHGLPYELITRSQLASRYPQFNVPDHYVALIEPNAGFLRPEMAIAALVERARAHGADVRANTQVLAWGGIGSGYTVDVVGESFSAPRLVVCSGAWTGSLLPPLRERLTVTRQPSAWFEPIDRAPLSLGTLPVWAIADGAGDFYYGFPMAEGEPTMKTAWHHVGQSTEADALDRVVHEREIEQLHRMLSAHLPAAAGAVRRSAVCMYTLSPDGHFIIDRLPDERGVVAVCGMSGHGFKFAPVAGRIIADLVESGSTDLPAGFLGLSRLA